MENKVTVDETRLDVYSGFRAFGFICALIGWLFFAIMLFIKLSGATIYATTEQSVIRTIDPLWDHAAKDYVSSNKRGSGFSFVIKIQGIQSNKN
jgi:hypothetical protein